MSWKQRERQGKRGINGQYTVMNPCEVCSDGTGNNYCSDERVNDPEFNGLGLVLCEPCGIKLAGMSDTEALIILKKGTAE
jgi:hypothetical protein